MLNEADRVYVGDALNDSLCVSINGDEFEAVPRLVCIGFGDAKAGDEFMAEVSRGIDGSIKSIINLASM